jgi:hypothetical protein
MKDVVLDGFMKNFSEETGLTGLDESSLFEAFAVSSILRKFHQTDTSDLEDFLTGGSGDGGIDATAILVNGHPARTAEHVDFFVEKLRRLDVEFVFIQAKTSAAFSAADIGTFVHGVFQFFAPRTKTAFHDELERLRKLKDYIYQRSINMERNPRCCLYYVSTGTWQNAQEPKQRLDDGSSRLVELNLFSQVDAIPIDAERLKTIYRELKRGVVKEVEFSKIAVFPRIDGVQEAYIGLLPGDQFIRLVTTEEDNLNRELFYDNVRDFQGNNPVNREIAQTISDSSGIGRFPLLNNGVTIVARSINRTGDVFRISDFQIVNGCQTTHMLYQNRSLVRGTFVPVKLVVTNESEVITEVIKATNRQTAVLPEALASLTPFHKELEDFYVAQEAGRAKQNRIYYERRSKQYAFDNVKPSNIVTLTAQTKSFVAMFLNEPHSHPRYYGELLKAYETRLFVHDHRPALYYASGYAFLAIERLFNSGQLNRSAKKWKYHILMLLRIQLGGVEAPRFNSRAADEYALEIVRGLRSEETCSANCQKAVETISREWRKFVFPSAEDPSRLKAFTMQLMEAVKVPVAQQGTIWRKVVSPTRRTRRDQVVRPKLDWSNVWHCDLGRKIPLQEKLAIVLRSRPTTKPLGCFVILQKRSARRWPGAFPHALRARTSDDFDGTRVPG